MRRRFIFDPHLAIDIRFASETFEPIQLVARQKRIVGPEDQINQTTENSTDNSSGTDLEGSSLWKHIQMAKMRLGTFKLEAILTGRAHNVQDKNNIFHGIWLQCLRNAWN